MRATRIEIADVDSRPLETEAYLFRGVVFGGHDVDGRGIIDARDGDSLGRRRVAVEAVAYGDRDGFRSRRSIVRRVTI